MTEELDYTQEEVLVCHQCISDPYLMEFIRNNGQNDVCNYCLQTLQVVLLDKIADKVEIAFLTFYRRTSPEPDGMELIGINEFGRDWDRAGDPVVAAIAEAIGANEDIASAIQQMLDERHWSQSAIEVGEETDFAEESHYKYAGVSANNWEDKWEELEIILKKQTRFFSVKIQQYLKDIFTDLDQLQTSTGESVAKYFGANAASTDIYRARSFSTLKEVENALSDMVKQLGPPPHEKARAGRMNAVGISVFYGASDAETAIAEVRPPVGATVIVAKFVFNKRVKLLDLRTLKDLNAQGSMFDEKYALLASRVQFLKQLGDRLTRPVMPDYEVTEYLVTQAIADHLSETTDFDGIIFNSIQAAGEGFNIILFYKAAKVMERKQAKGAKSSLFVDWHDGDDDPPSYVLLEEIHEAKQVTQPVIEITDYLIRRDERDDREASLQIDAESIVIHEIASAKYNSYASVVKLSQMRN